MLVDQLINGQAQEELYINSGMVSKSILVVRKTEKGSSVSEVPIL